MAERVGVGMTVREERAVREGRAEPIRGRGDGTEHAARAVDVFVRGMVSPETGCGRRGAVGDWWGAGRHGHACANVGGGTRRGWGDAGGT